jgi:hypothetical protein
VVRGRACMARSAPGIYSDAEACERTNRRRLRAARFLGSFWAVACCIMSEDVGSLGL